MLSQCSWCNTQCYTRARHESQFQLPEAESHKHLCLSVSTAQELVLGFLSEECLIGATVRSRNKDHQNGKESHLHALPQHVTLSKQAFYGMRSVLTDDKAFLILFGQARLSPLARSRDEDKESRTLVLPRVPY